MSSSSRINKSTAVGALAACAVVGATSPVWADSGPNSSQARTRAVTAHHGQLSDDAQVISALRAEIAKLQAELKAEGAALHDATQAASTEAKALRAAKAEIARLKSATDTAVTPGNVMVSAVDNKAHRAAARGFAGHRCDHHGRIGDRGDVRAHDYRFDDHGHHDGDRRSRG